MIQPVFAIPSHGRADYQPTIEYLHSLSVPAERIVLCVRDTEVKDYDKWKPFVRAIIPESYHNLGGALNSLLDYLQDEKYILELDDDVTHIAFLQKDKLVPLKDGKKFAEFLNYGFTYAIKSGAKLWGIYPVYNAFFMKNKVRDRALLIGTFLGIINEGMRFNPEFVLKMDFDYCCRSMKKYGKVIRFENVSVKARHYSKGGCEKEWSKNELMGKMLLERHGDILKPNSKRPGEVLLK